MEHRRVVVTGLGLICGVGKTAPELWEGLMAGRPSPSPSGLVPGRGNQRSPAADTVRQAAATTHPLVGVEQARLRPDPGATGFCGTHDALRREDHLRSQRARRLPERLRVGPGERGRTQADR